MKRECCSRPEDLAMAMVDLDRTLPGVGFAAGVDGLVEEGDGGDGRVPDGGRGGDLDCGRGKEEADSLTRIGARRTPSDLDLEAVVEANGSGVEVLVEDLAMADPPDLDLEDEVDEGLHRDLKRDLVDLR